MMTRTARRCVLSGIIVLLVIPIVAIRLRSHSTVGSPGGSLADKFNKKYLNRVSFPDRYDGQPSAKAPPEQREKIITVHSDYWRNYAKIERARFWYSRHRFHDGKLQDDNFSMDAQVEMRYGYGIEIEGKNAQGKYFHVALNPEGRLFPDESQGDLSSVMLSMFQAFWAYPEQISLVDNVQQGVSRDDAPGIHYNVLSNPGQSEQPPYGPSDRKLWFNQDTGMLERIEYCDPVVKRKVGQYDHISFIYAKIGSIYMPTRIVSEFASKGNRFVEEYSKISVDVRQAASGP